MGWAGAKPGPGRDAGGGGRSAGAAAGAPRGAARPGGPDPGRSSEGVEEGRAQRGREASPLLPGGRRRRGPAVAKEKALPGHGRGGAGRNGGRKGPRAAREAGARGEGAARAVVCGSCAAAAAKGPGGGPRGFSGLASRGRPAVAGGSRWATSGTPSRLASNPRSGAGRRRCPPAPAAERPPPRPPTAWALTPRVSPGCSLALLFL